MLVDVGCMVEEEALFFDAVDMVTLLCTELVGGRVVDDIATLLVTEAEEVESVAVTDAVAGLKTLVPDTTAVSVGVAVANKFRVDWRFSLLEAIMAAIEASAPVAEAI